MLARKLDLFATLKAWGGALCGSVLVAAAIGTAPIVAYAADGIASDNILTPGSIAVQDEAEAWDWIVRLGDAGQSTGESTQNALTYVDTVNDVMALGDGSLVAAGGYDWKGLENIPENHGSCDGLVVKYNANRTEAWRAHVGGSGDDYFSAVAQLADGRYVAVGFAKSLDGDMSGIAKHEKATAYDGLVAVFDESSVTEGTLAASGVAAFGGTGNDYFQDVVATDDGGFVAVGRTASKDVDLAGKRDDAASSASALIAKFDKDLNLQWSTVVDASSKSYDELYSVVEDDQGNFVASGYFAAPKGDLESNAKGGKDGALVKFDKDGAVIWTKVYGSSGNDELSSVTLDCNAGGGVAGAQGYVVAGYATSLDNDLASAASEGYTAPEKGMPWMLRVDADGNVAKSRVIEAEAVDATAHIATCEDGYLVAGSYRNASDVLGEADSDGDVYLARVRGDFSVLGAQAFRGAAKDVAKSIAIASDGSAFVSGRFLSAEFCTLQRAAKKANGYIMRLDPSTLIANPDEQFTIPVTAIKAGMANESANVSMAGGCLHDSAYVKKYGSAYEVTMYLKGITVMGTTVDAKDIAPLKYDSDGDGKSDSLALRDTYDPDTHVRTVVIPVNDLSQKTTAYLHMADVDLYFDADEKVDVADEPSFFESDSEKAANANALIEAAAANPNAQNVAAARAAYEALSDAQKALVSADALKSLEGAEQAVKDAAEAAEKAAKEKADQEKAAQEKAAKEKADQEKAAAEEADLANGTLKVESASLVYTGKEIRPVVIVTTKGGKTLSASDYAVEYANNVNAGTASVTVTGKEPYTGSVSTTFTIAKGSQAVTLGKAKITKAYAGKKLVKKGKLAKKQKIKLAKLAKASAKTKLVFKKANKAGGNKIVVAKGGKVTVKKGLAKGTYKVKVKVTAAAGENYNAAKAKTITLTIKVK